MRIIINDFGNTEHWPYILAELSRRICDPADEPDVLMDGSINIALPDGEVVANVEFEEDTEINVVNNIPENFSAAALTRFTGKEGR